MRILSIEPYLLKTSYRDLTSVSRLSPPTHTTCHMILFVGSRVCMPGHVIIVEIQNGGGGGVQQQKRQRTSCDFPGGMIFFVLFCPLFEDILLTKSGKNNKKEHKRSKNTKIMIFFVLF